MPVRLNLPAYYNLVENDTFELFFRGIVEASDPYRYNIRIDCERGAIFRRKYVYTPLSGNAGIYPRRTSCQGRIFADCRCLLSGSHAVSDTASLTNRQKSRM